MSVVVQALDLVEGHVRHKVHKCEDSDEEHHYKGLENLLPSWTLFAQKNIQSATILRNCLHNLPSQ